MKIYSFIISILILSLGSNLVSCKVQNKNSVSKYKKNNSRKNGRRGGKDLSINQFRRNKAPRGCATVVEFNENDKRKPSPLYGTKVRKRMEQDMNSDRDSSYYKRLEKKREREKRKEYEGTFFTRLFSSSQRYERELRKSKENQTTETGENENPEINKETQENLKAEREAKLKRKQERKRRRSYEGTFFTRLFSSSQRYERRLRKSKNKKNKKNHKEENYEELD